MRFDSVEHLETFNKTGEYPKIHDDIFKLIKSKELSACKTAVDIGCCVGLISSRLVTEGYESVVGIEGNKNYIEKAIKDERISYKNYYVCGDTLDRLKEDTVGIDVVIARRVFPEISEGGGVEIIKTISKLLHDNGVKYIVLEGRKKVSKPTNKLYTAKIEAMYLSEFYKPVSAYKDCILLKKR